MENELKDRIKWRAKRGYKQWFSTLKSVRNITNIEFEHFLVFQEIQLKNRLKTDFFIMLKDQMNFNKDLHPVSFENVQQICWYQQVHTEIDWSLVISQRARFHKQVTDFNRRV